jgi:uncharacterized protein (TIGR02145 family)
VGSTITYTGGNGGAFSAQSVASTGVTGLTATLAAGTLEFGSGTLAYTITGTPLGAGTANFAISLGGQGCIITRSVSPAAGGSGSVATCGTPNIHNPNLTYGTMTDQEGNLYKTIVIGTQEWMAENLNTSIYRNGDAIATNLENSNWENTITGAWAYQNNIDSYACPYGKLYNWHACADVRNLCPTGWHVSSYQDMSDLLSFLDPNFAEYLYSSQAGYKMKSTGTTAAATGLWYNPNFASNSSGFSGVPGGWRYCFGDYTSIGDSGGWWSSSAFDALNGWFILLNHDTEIVYLNPSSKCVGMPVRCVRD